MSSAAPSAPDRERRRAERANELAAVSEPFEDELADIARRVVAQAVAATGFVGAGLTAAADPVDLSALGSIPGAWEQAVGQATVKHYTGIYGQGQVAGFVSTTLGESMVKDRIADTDVVNVAATEAARNASNRLVNVSDDLWLKARDSLAEGIAAGDDLDQRQRRLEALLDSSEARARTVARTEATAAYNEGQASVLDLLGEDAPGWKEWLATRDPRTRDSHWLADGQVVPSHMPFIVGGHHLMYPGDRNVPGYETINCRCTMLLLDEPPPGWSDPSVAAEGEEDSTPLVPEQVTVEDPQAVAPEPPKRPLGEPKVKARALDPESLGDLDVDKAGPGDQLLGQIYERQGFHELPDLVSESELDALIAADPDDWVEGFRGITEYSSDPAFARGFIEGPEHHPGLGIHGNGTYVAYGPSVHGAPAGTWDLNALEVARGYAGGNEETQSIVRLAWRRSEMKVIEKSELWAIQRERLAYIDSRWRAAKQAAKGVTWEDPEVVKWENLRAIYSDEGRAAAAEGYDAIQVPRGNYFSTDTKDPDWNGGYLVLLNRSAVVMQRNKLPYQPL